MLSKWGTALLIAMSAIGVMEGAAVADDYTQLAYAPDNQRQNVDGDVSAAEMSHYSQGAQHSDLSDLTLENFFTSGWSDEFVKRERATETPNMALLRVQTNFLERELRLNYYDEENVNSKTQKRINDLDGLIAWGFDRRLMIEITGAYQWVDPRSGAVESSGGFPGFVSRVQLIDTESSSYSFNCRVLAPDPGIGQTQTTFSYGLAGYEDLAYYFDFKRVAFYYSVLFDTLDGPAVAGSKHNDAGYDVTLAKTFTEPDTPLFGNLTLFVENYAQTDLDGSHTGRTLVSITPGMRFNLGKTERIKLGKDNWLMFGPDIPVSNYHPWDAIYRFTYITNF